MNDASLTLHRSNQVEELGRAFVDLMRREPLRDPFQPETVLVGSTGLRDWLRRRLAEELGIAARLSFVYAGTLGSWLHQAHRVMGASGGEAAGRVSDVLRAPDAGEETPWVPDRLVWVVASELLAWRTRAEANPHAADKLSTYLLQLRTDGEGPGLLSSPLFALATEISRLFLRYHAWRPGMIAAWAAAQAQGAERRGAPDRYTRRDGTLVPFDQRASDLAWQPELWRRVRDRLSRGGAPDPLAELGALTTTGEALHGDNLAAVSLAKDASLRAALRSVLPPRLSLFGVSNLSPLQLLTLSRIAEAVPVHWFLTAPTPFWLGDQTLAGLARQDKRRRAFLDVQGARTLHHVYLGDARERAESMGGEVDPIAAPATSARTGEEEVGGHPSFDDLEGVVCPLVAAFGRVPRANQLLLEEIVPNAREGETAFVHPLVAASEAHDAARAQGEGRSALADTPSVLQRLQADVYMLEASAYEAQPEAGTPFRHDMEGGDALVSRRGDRGIDPQDRSLGFHACYGPSRQVDAVRDLIVEALAQDPTLWPEDIAVMTPDIATYAPLIEATFAPHAPQGESLERTGIPGIPIRIQDRAIRSTNPVAGVLLALLALAEGRRSVSEVIGLLGLEPVHSHYGMEREEVSRVEGWLRAAGARWGVDAADVLQVNEAQGGQALHGALGAGEPDDQGPLRSSAGVRPADSRLRHTLLAALERIALGAVMPLEAVAGAEGATLGAVGREGALPVVPLDEAGDRDLAAKAVLFLETLIGALEELRSPRSLQAWLKVFAHESDEEPGLLQRFITLPSSRAWQKAQVIDELEALGRDTAVLGLGAGAESVQVTPSAMAAWMRARMDRADKRVSDGLDAVTFCSLMPVRSVPYRWVILLGVDQEIFPRAGTRPAWDIIAREPRPWDRNPRDEDRALFLDALLSARDACHIVYTGRTPQRDEEVAPAAPVAQLLEMLDRRFEAPAPVAGAGKRPSASQWLTRHYPLQPFSDRNFRQEEAEQQGMRAPRPIVYHAGERRAAESLARGRGSATPWALQVPWDAEPALPAVYAERSPLTLTLRELADFHEDPLGAWLADVVGLRWQKKEEAAADDLLPVASGVLERLEVIKQATRQGLAWDDVIAAAFPTLPIGPSGRDEGRSLVEKAARLQAKLYGAEGLFEEPETRRLEVTLEVDRVPGVAGSLAVRLCGDVALASWRDNARGGGVVLSTQYSTVRGKHAVKAWLRLLLALAAEERAWNADPGLDGVVVGVASHKPDADISAHGVSLSDLDCPRDGEGARAWARGHLEERVRTWLAGHCRPMPLLPSDSLSIVKAGYKAFADAKSQGGDGAEAPLAAWLRALASVDLPCAPLSSSRLAREADPWAGALASLHLVLGGTTQALRLDSAVGKMRAAARATWNRDMFVADSDRWKVDTEKSILQRIFGEEGPAQRWPEAFVVESWRVFGPAVALEKAMETNELTRSGAAPFDAWRRGGTA